MNTINILGVPIHVCTPASSIKRLRKMLDSNTQYHVATPNNEMLVEAAKNKPFHTLLNNTDLNLPDSTGLLLAARWTGQHLPERVTGVDTVQTLCSTLDASVPVFLLGAAEGVADKAAAILKQCNPHLTVVGTYSGSPKTEDATEIIRRINNVAPALLLVAFGAPAQEQWIATYGKKLTTVKVAIGVGGTFDFLAGKRKRAPLWLRNVGLEWMWRLVQEPTRLRRIFNATVVFLWLILRYRKASPH